MHRSPMKSHKRLGFPALLAVAAIEAGIPDARRIVVEGTGHIVYLEKPAEFCRLVFDFIRQ